MSLELAASRTVARVTRRGSDAQIDHVSISIVDEEAARVFYRSAMSVLGMTESVDPRGRVEYGRDGRYDFGFYGSTDDYFKQPHIAFLALSREHVDRFYRAALNNGGASLSAPAERTEFGLYSTYVWDPEGHVLEVACPLE